MNNKFFYIKLLWLLLLFFLSQKTIAQNCDTSKIDVFLKRANNLSNIELDSALYYIDSVFGLLKNCPDNIPSYKKRFAKSHQSSAKIKIIQRKFPEAESDAKNSFSFHRKFTFPKS